jgi:hypothetical protein
MGRQKIGRELRDGYILRRRGGLTMIDTDLFHYEIIDGSCGTYMGRFWNGIVLDKPLPEWLEVLPESFGHGYVLGIYEKRGIEK